MSFIADIMKELLSHEPSLKDTTVFKSTLPLYVNWNAGS